MARYRKKPIEVEAVQFTEETRQQIIDWCDPRHTNMDDDGCLYETANLFIRTPEGEMMAQPGDYIIKGIAGEFYPCKPDIFEQTYEAVA